jgi:hypothetical protein
VVVAETSTCAKCGEQPAGPGRILCPGCRQRIERPLVSYWEPTGTHDSENSDASTQT